MSDHLPEWRTTATTEKIDGQPAFLVLRPDFKQLFSDIKSENEKAFKVLKKSPSRRAYITGAVIVDYVSRKKRLGDIRTTNAFVPQYRKNVRQWPIPGTKLWLTDLNGALVAVKEGWEHPSVIDLLHIYTKIELEQLLSGLRDLQG